MENQPWESARPMLLATAALLVLLFTVYQYARRKLDPREPAVVGSVIPVIGHVVGMIASGGRYTKRIARRHYPIFTLPMPGSRMYIVTDPALAAAVQKTKTLSFNPIIPEVTKRILGLDDKAVQILKTNIGREHGPEGFYPEVHDLVYSTMAPGERLDELTTRATDMFRTHLETYARSLQEKASGTSAEELLSWTQHIVTTATAEFLYGAQNPIAIEPSLEAAFWDFDHGLGQLLAFADLMPSITARKAYKGREAVVAALLKYFEADHYKSGSSLIQHRYRIAEKYGMSRDGIARSELSFLFAGIVNTAVTSFWVIVHIFARPSLLSVVREEIQSCLRPSSSKGDSTEIDPQALVTACPLLLSVYRETLRLGSDNSSNRLVTSDTLLADQYFLAKGSIVQVSGAAMHNNANIWGTDVDAFDPYRFLPDRIKAAGVHPAAFRAFGGGTTICPGRHFATREILYFVAAVLVMFDIEAMDGGVIKIPEKKDNVLPVHILEPRGKLNVRIKLREQK